MTIQDFSSMRDAMVSSQLRTNDISNPSVVRAFSSVARERFVPPKRTAVAYTDVPVPLTASRSLNAPLATARLINQAMPVAGDAVLLIGAATGYSAAILARLGCVVTAVEEDKALAQTAIATLSNEAGVTIITGPLVDGCAINAPYDVIIFDGAVATLPKSIVDQCGEGGRVAAGLVDGGVVRLASGYKVAGTIVLIPFADCQAVILPGFAAPKEFVF